MEPQKNTENNQHISSNHKQLDEDRQIGLSKVVLLSLIYKLLAQVLKTVDASEHPLDPDPVELPKGK